VLDTAPIVVRFLHYGGLSLLFGITAFQLYGYPAKADEAKKLRWRPLLITLTAFSLIISAIGLIFLSAQMSGSFAAAVRPRVFSHVLATDAGVALIVRTLALALCVTLLVGRNPSRPVVHAIVCLAMVSLGSLAWGGHALQHEGWAGILHLVADVLHLLSAGAWLGAIAALLLLIGDHGHPADSDHISRLSLALRSFSIAGSAIVATLIVSGIVNAAFIVGWPDFDFLYSRYGQLLGVKLALFLVMIAFAALNRYHLTPQLERSAARGDCRAAIRTLHRSIAAELFVALTILGLVAWLGFLAPYD
jgi:putative copper resistance protein D